MKHFYAFLLAFLMLIPGLAAQETGTVYIAKLGIGFPTNYAVFHGDQCIGLLKGIGTTKEYIKYQVPAGKHYFHAVFGDRLSSLVALEVTEGEAYYLEVNASKNELLFDATENGKKRDRIRRKMIGGTIVSPSPDEKEYFETENGEEIRQALAAAENKEAEFSSMVASANAEEVYEAQAETTEEERVEAVASAEYADVETSAAEPSRTEAVTEATTPVTPDFTEAENLREAAWKHMIENASNGSSAYLATNYASANSVTETYDVGRVSRSEDNLESELKYRRSSLYTLMINDTIREHFGSIKNAFGDAELSQKFNDHNIGPYLIDAPGGEKDQTDVITNYLNEQGVARQLVAKWFNRNANGEFNMDLVAERGSYNASELEKMVAEDTRRGAALLADAGEELIGNTFVIVNDYKFTNKEEVASKASGVLSIVSTVASYAGMDAVSLVADGVNIGVGIAGKGYVIKTTAYLYRLEWNEEVAAKFYSNYWIDANNYDAAKKEAFESSDLFKLRLVGTEVAWADLQSSAFTTKSDEELIRIATMKATDKGISKLERKFEEFRTKSPLLSGNPIAAKIGTKEGVEKGDKYEVLEQRMDDSGKTFYKRVGTIKVDKNAIWDNSYPDEEGGHISSGKEYTEFKGAKGKYYSGMLIRQIN